MSRHNMSRLYASHKSVDLLCHKASPDACEQRMHADICPEMHLRYQYNHHDYRHATINKDEQSVTSRRHVTASRRLDTASKSYNN